RIHDKQQTKMISDRLYIEEESIGKYFLEIYKKNTENVSYIKMLLFYHYVNAELDDLRKSFYNILVKNNELSSIEKLKYYYLFVKGYGKRIVKRVYRKYIAKTFR